MQYDKTSHSAGHHLHPVNILISNFSKIHFMSFFHLSQQLPIPLFPTDFPPNNFETIWCAPRVQNILPNFFSPIYFTNGLKSQGAKNFQKSKNKLKILTKKFPRWGTTNIRHHRTKFSLPGELALGIFEPGFQKAGHS